MARHSINTDKLTREMFVRGLDEEELAGIAGVSNVTVSSVLKGRRIRMETLVVKGAFTSPLSPGAPSDLSIRA